MMINNYNNYSPVSVNFNGHAGCEEIITRLGMRNCVTTETRFFRDYESMKFGVNYVKEVFKNLKEKYFIVGACSTGEDAHSLKMLMGNEPVKITGFDIGAETVEQAKSGIFNLYVPADNKTNKYTRIVDMTTYNDSFLCSEKSNLTPEEKKLKEVFLKNFESIDTKDKLIYKLKETFRRMFDITYAEFNKLKFRYKNTNADLEFKTADIRDFKNILPDKKGQIFAFKNSFYHIVTDNNICSRQELPRKEVKPMLDSIFKNVNKSLDMNGLFIMGEKEHEQKTNVHIIAESLLDNGFLPIRMPDRPYLNVWKKIKEAD